MTQKELNEIFEAVYYGNITLDNLPDPLYFYYAKELQKAVNKGFNSSLKLLPVDSPEWDLLNHFRENTNIFSGAKTFQQIKDSQNFILDAQGELRPFNDYLKDVRKIDAVYRESWLQVERDTAISQGQSARKWMDIESQKDILSYLVFRTQGDGRVRDEHAALEGFTAKVDDPAWNSLTPPIDWNDRCYLEQIQEAVETTKEQKQGIIQQMNVGREKPIKNFNDIPPPLFRMNPAKDKIIFKNEGIGSHPYFKVDQAYEVLKTNNFGVDINYVI